MKSIPDPQDPLQRNGSNLFRIYSTGEIKSPLETKSGSGHDSPESGGDDEGIGFKNPPEGINFTPEIKSLDTENPVIATDLGESGISGIFGAPLRAQAGVRAHVIEVNSALSGTQEPEEGVSSGIGEAMDPVEGAEPLSSAMRSPLSPFGGDEPPEGGKDTAALDLNCVTP